MMYAESENNTPSSARWSQLSPPPPPHCDITTRTLTLLEETEYCHFPMFPSLQRSDSSDEVFILKPRPLSRHKFSSEISVIEDADSRFNYQTTQQVSSKASIHPFKVSIITEEARLHALEQLETHFRDVKIDVPLRRNSKNAISA